MSVAADNQSDNFYSSSDNEDLWEEDCFRQFPHLQWPNEDDLSVETESPESNSEPDPVCPCSACVRGNLITDIYKTGCIKYPENTTYGAKTESDPIEKGCQTEIDPFATSNFVTKS